MRRIALWFGLWLAVLGWDALFPHLARPDATAAAIGLVGAWLVLAVLLREKTIALSPRLAAAGLAAAAIASLALPWPERLGAILLAAACAIAAWPRGADGLRALLWRPTLGLGMLLVLFAALSHLYAWTEAAVHDIDALAAPIAFIYRAIGVQAVADPPFVHWQGIGLVHTFDCSIEKFVGPALALFAGGALAAACLLRGARIGWRLPVALVLSLAAFAVTRLLAFGLLLDQIPHPGIFYLRPWVMGGLLPLIPLLAAFVPVPSRAPARAGRVAALGLADLRAPSAAALLAAAAAAGALAAGTAGFFDPGRLKTERRVLIDERHSNWEWTTIAFDTETYGVQTVYNYSELLRYLRHFFDVQPNMAPITDSLLARTDVMILKTPTQPYDADEVDALVRFVERGGGLWLVGDHTNVFGMSSNLNKVARRFGLRFRFDAVVDLLTHGRQLYERPRLFPHPSVRHLPPILMATSCSLVGPASAERVIQGRSLLSDELDYSTNTFFGNFLPDAGEPFGAMLQSAAVLRGKGRVLAFTDSTIFSNFFMFIRGKKELALGSVWWLMHENRWAWLRRALLVGVLIATALLVGFALRVPRATAVACILLAGLPAFALTARGLERWVRGWSELPAPRVEYDEVVFERGRTAYVLPDIADVPERSPASFHTFYVWTQRVGYIPSTRLFEKCFEGSKAVVLINPRDHFTAKDVASVRSYVEGGGSLLVLETPHTSHSTANEVLAPFGMRFEGAEVESVAVRDAASGDSIAVLHHAGHVGGGKPVLLLPDGAAALSMARYGEGRVVAACASDNFSDAVLGTTSEVPSAEQLALYRIVFRIFDELLRTGDRAGTAADTAGGG